MGHLSHSSFSPVGNYYQCCSHHAAAPAMYCCLIIAATALQLVRRAILQLETAVVGNGICLAEVFEVGGEVYPC